MTTGRIFHGRETPPVREHGGRLPVALVFPGPAALALSTLGWQIVYQLLAAHDDYAPERFFLDDPTAPPRSVDTQRPLTDFPVVAYSLNFEEEYLALAQSLAAADIPLRRAARTELPLVMIGGPLAWLNPAPIAPAVDVFFVGEAEAGLMQLFATWKAGWLGGDSREEMLAAAAHLPGVYAPGLSRTPVRRAVAQGQGLASPGASCFTSPQATFKDMFVVEINRGCPYGCRFCAAGYIYRPARHAELAELKTIVREAAPRKVGLLGTALTDWPDLLPFLEWLTQEEIGVSLSSLRADGITDELLGFLRARGVRTITLALEAPSTRLRQAANKKLDEDVFLRAVSLCAKHGVNHLKVYLIVGWPDETPEDYAELGMFMRRIDEARGGFTGKKSMRVTLSGGPLVPKPWTPMQWAPMADESAVKAAAAAMKTAAKTIKGFSVEVEGAFSARLQGLLARGDDAVFGLVELAASKGGWRKAMKAWGGDVSWYIDRERAEDEAFPWEVVDMGVDRAYLWREWQRYKQARTTPTCPPDCASCGRCGIDRWLGGSGPEPVG